MLSGYDNQLYKKRLKGLYRKDFDGFANCLNNKAKNPNRARTETIWANYDLSEREGQIKMFNEN